MRKLLMALSLLTLPLLGSLRAPERLGSVALLNTPNGFAVFKDGKVNNIEPDCVDTMIRKMDYKQRNAYILKGGAIELNQATNKQYTIKAVANLKGGGPILGWFCYGIVMISGSIVIAVAKKFDRSGTAPTGQMFENLKSVANVVKCYGDTAPTP